MIKQGKIYVLIKKAPRTEPLNVFAMSCCSAENIREAIKKFGAVIDGSEKRPCYRNTHKNRCVISHSQTAQVVQKRSGRNR